MHLNPMPAAAVQRNISRQHRSCSSAAPPPSPVRGRQCRITTSGGDFIPPVAQRDLRDLTRQCTNLIQDRSTVVHRLHKVLEWANIKLTSVVSDVTGVSARRMLEAMLDGQTNVQIRADLAKGRMRSKRAELEQALAGCVREHHRFIIAEHLVQLDNLDEQLTRFDARIAALVQTQSASADPPTCTDHSTPTPSDTSIVRIQTESSEPGAEPSPADPAPPHLLTWEQAVTVLDTIPGLVVPRLKSSSRKLART